MKPKYTKAKLSDCPTDIYLLVVDNMKFVGWKESRDGYRSQIIVTFKDGKFYGYGLI